MAGRLGRAVGALALLAGLGAGCDECFPTVVESGEETLEQRQRRDRTLEEVEGAESPESRQ